MPAMKELEGWTGVYPKSQHASHSSAGKVISCHGARAIEPYSLGPSRPRIDCGGRAQPAPASCGENGGVGRLSPQRPSRVVPQSWYSGSLVALDAVNIIIIVVTFFGLGAAILLLVTAPALALLGLLPCNAARINAIRRATALPLAAHLLLDGSILIGLRLGLVLWMN